MEVRGWVRSKRGQKHVAFVTVGDGSGLVQVVCDPAIVSKCSNGAAVSFTGLMMMMMYVCLCVCAVIDEC